MSRVNQAQAILKVAYSFIAMIGGGFLALCIFTSFSVGNSKSYSSDHYWKGTKIEKGENYQNTKPNEVKQEYEHIEGKPETDNDGLEEKHLRMKKNMMKRRKGFNKSSCLCNIL